MKSAYVTTHYEWRDTRHLATVKQVCSIVLLSIFLVLCVEHVKAEDFRINKMITVGPIYGGGLYEPAKWSPDGTLLAYFSDGELLVSDTLGNSRTVSEIDLAPHSYQWINNDEIVLFQRNIGEDRIILSQLLSINISDGSKEMLIENYRKMGQKYSEDKIAFEGPYRTVEGLAAYKEIRGEATRELQVVGQNTSSKPGAQQRSVQHILRNGEDALYLVRLDELDSTKISNRPYKPYIRGSLRLSPDKKYIMFGGNIVRLEDDNLIVLDTIIKEFPTGTAACGFGNGSFNPVATEVLFKLSCDDGHSFVVDRIGIYDYASYEFTILDTIIGISNCRRPEFSPDGRRISFLSHGVLYFLEREVKR